MHDVAHQTLVYRIEPSPLGLLDNRWAMEHRCNLRRRAVPTDQLLNHRPSPRRADLLPKSHVDDMSPSKPPGNDPFHPTTQDNGADCAYVAFTIGRT